MATYLKVLLFLAAAGGFLYLVEKHRAGSLPVAIPLFLQQVVGVRLADFFFVSLFVADRLAVFIPQGDAASPFHGAPAAILPIVLASIMPAFTATIAWFCFFCHDRVLRFEIGNSVIYGRSKS